ncbi:putative mediator of RNA polymerase II transcription subunit 21 isoform X5 [Sitodiplosis mosellana]|nr:putative mediator of RNA polymerase II transcription subunit 21 isoform X5 [Sitodiplosis mosellana]XP_055323554.1 putative mediator of RNA polymerase II transcription subunit 21 isoform X5 [Sitodiplosis mosellana]
MLTSMRHHTKLLFISIALFEVIGLSLAQRVAPGVPPSQYQQNVQYHQAPPQYQQQQAQYQQYQQQGVPQQQQQYQQQVPQQQQFQQPPPQQQFQQPPPQQQQQQQFQQPPPQQVPDGHGHGHAHGGANGGVLSGNVNEEKEHIQEHMEVPIDTSKMSEQELQFHYFTMHDSDKNNKLDGSELIKSLIHWHEQGSKENSQQMPQVEEKVFTDEELVQLIDPILKMDDTSNDGYIDYPEFIRAQQKAAAQQQQHHQQQPQHR